MDMKVHQYTATIAWTGNTGEGTLGYKTYKRDHSVIISGKTDIHGSSDPQFRGDRTRHNPEELFLSSISSCHMLWYLHLCSEAGVIVTGYVDHATGIMTETADGGGHFTAVTLNPEVTVSEESMIGKANSLHHKANELCFIANSVNFPIQHQPTAKSAQ